MESRRKKLVAAKARLGQNEEEEVDSFSGPLGKKAKPVVRKNWRSTLIACGSNAFSQNSDGLDIMSSKFAPIPFGDATGDPRHAFPVQISCGSTISACVTAGGDAYMWGSGFGPTLRMPTLITVNQVKQISCGATHTGLVTHDGKCYTWGSGDNGMLGHGHRHSISTPQRVAAFDGSVCLQISCGAYHTAVIAERLAKVQYVRVPGSQASPDSRLNASASSPSFDRSRRDEAGNGNGLAGIGAGGRPMSASPSQAAIDGGASGGETLSCGSLYTFGLGKAGQLGQGAVCQSSAVPLLLAYFNEQRLNVCKVSCGMHHTLVIALQAANTRLFSTCLYSFGWGEHGRLGLGHEDQMNSPMQVQFQEPFHPTQISAGEQHSLASGKQGCYAWGSNSFGQCGAGNPNSTPQCLIPTKIPIPEGIKVIKVAAGGRHSAAVSVCGKLMSWGWGEEGQLGHGTERDASLPKPCRIPRIGNSTCVPLDAALGLCHTIVLVQNKDFDFAEFVPSPKRVEPIEPPAVVFKSPVKVIVVEEVVEEVAPAAIEEEEDETPPIPAPLEIILPVRPAVREDAVFVIETKTPVPKTPDVTPVKPQVTVGIMDILRQREERRERAERELQSQQAVLPPSLSPVRFEAPPVVSRPPEVEQPRPALPIEPDICYEPDNSKRPPKAYDFDPKLNTAYRAEVRRQQRLAKEEADSSSRQSNSTKQKPSRPLSGTRSVAPRRNSGSTIDSAVQNSEG